MEQVTRKYKVAESSCLPESLKEFIKSTAKEYNLSEAETEFVRKGLEPYKQPDFNEGEKSVITYITTGALDRDKEIVKPDGGDFTNYLKHPVVLFGHKYSELPVGKCLWLKASGDNKGIIAKTVYANTPQADLIYNYRKDSFPLATSIGFIPIKSVSIFDISRKEEFATEVKNAVQMGWIKEEQAPSVRNIIQKWALLEFSDVSVPCNPEALQIACSKGLISKEELEEEVKSNGVEIQFGAIDDKTEYILEDEGETCKAVIPFSASPVNEGVWDGEASRNRLAKWASSDNSGSKDKIDWVAYGKGFTYKDESGDKFGDFHFPHHDIMGGKFVVVWRGVAAAMAALKGARGAKIPKVDKDGIYSHLSKHYKQFKKTPPEKDFEDISTKTTMPPKMESGVVPKKLDDKGNPSVRDIMDCIHKALRKNNLEQFKKEAAEKVDYFWIEDMFPVNYPDGHCICCCCMGDGGYRYVNCAYTYDPITKIAEVGVGAEVDATWLPSKAALGAKQYIDIDNYLKSFTLEQVKKLPLLPVMTQFSVKDEPNLYFAHISETGDVFKEVRTISSENKIDKERMEGVEKYKNTRVAIAEKSFSNLSSLEPKNREEWEKLYIKWLDFFLVALPGKDVIKEFCALEKVMYKGISEVPKEVPAQVVENELSKEQVVTLISGVVAENNKSMANMINDSLAKMLGKCQL